MCSCIYNLMSLALLFMTGPVGETTIVLLLILIIFCFSAFHLFTVFDP